MADEKESSKKEEKEVSESSETSKQESQTKETASSTEQDLSVAVVNQAETNEGLEQQAESVDQKATPKQEPDTKAAPRKERTFNVDSSNPYDILGLSKNATENEIRSAYKAAALKFHPDKNKSPEAEAIFKKISNAYDTLTDPTKLRKFRDQEEKAAGAQEETTRTSSNSSKYASTAPRSDSSPRPSYKKNLNSTPTWIYEGIAAARANQVFSQNNGNENLLQKLIAALNILAQYGLDKKVHLVISNDTQKLYRQPNAINILLTTDKPHEIETKFDKFVHNHNHPDNRPPLHYEDGANTSSYVFPNLEEVKSFFNSTGETLSNLASSALKFFGFDKSSNANSVGIVQERGVTPPIKEPDQSLIVRPLEEQLQHP